jgi:hypothetical protein
MVTLYVTPVFYVYMDRVDGWIKRRRRHAAHAAEGAPAGAPGA